MSDDLVQRDNTGNTSTAESYTRRLQIAESTVNEIRDKHEADLMEVKMANIKRLGEMDKATEEELQKLSLKVAREVNSYETQLMEKYVAKYGEDVTKNANLQKQLQQEILEFSRAKTAQVTAEEYKQEQQNILFIKNAAKDAAADIYATKMTSIQDQQKHSLANIQNAKYAELQANNELGAAKEQLLKATLSGDEKAIKAAQERVDKAQKEAKLKKDQYSKAKEQYKEDKKAQKAAIQAAKDETAAKMREGGATELEIMKTTGELTGAAVKEAVFSKETANTVADNLLKGLKDMFEATISSYGSYQSKINTRLQGSGKTWQGNAALGLLGLPTGGVESNLKTAIGSNPYVKLQAVMDNVVKATEQGIAYNIEQRAFLATVSENIASTFDAFDANLLRVIRLQQSDTTAARLGLEANLTSLFNSLYQDTSYLNDSFDTVSGNLTEAISQMTSEEGVAFEYTVQKWLGALSSVGFSSDAVIKISQAIGYLGSGDISSLSNNSEMQNLIVMAASRAGMSYSDMLIDGLNSSNTNKLMKSMVEYLQEIANSDNKVVKSQYAQIFGMSVSDLKAVDNLSTTIETVNSTMLDYGGAMSELYSQMGQLGSRVSTAGMLNNLMENVKYSIGTGIASNPATYALWEVTSMIEDLTGGISLPTISAFGSSVDLKTTVTNLMRAGIVGVSTLGSIGSIISGLSGAASTFAPSSMLSKLGIENSSTANKTQLARGVGFNRKTKQLNQMSSSTMVGNASGSDYYQSTLASANEQTATTAEAAKEESTDKTTNDIYDYLVTVFDPKFTEIEKLLAVASGYAAKEESNTAFKSTDTRSSATNVTITYESADGKARVDTNTLLSTINGNVAEILTHVASLDKKALDNSMLSPSSVI